MHSIRKLKSSASRTRTSPCSFPNTASRPSKTTSKGFPPKSRGSLNMATATSANPLPSGLPVKPSCAQRKPNGFAPIGTCLYYLTSGTRWFGGSSSSPRPSSTREFLWQEGHTAHLSQKEAMDFVLTILNLYRNPYLAVPVIPGEKSENERFAGGHATTTIETFIPTTGRAVQAATSHYLGQNFAKKMFGIQYQDAAGNSQLVHQTSWGCTTRTLGVMVMVHGDDKGLVIPPRVVHTQVVIVPIIYKDSNLTQLEDQCKELMATLRKDGLRVKTDLRENYTPGWKFNHWKRREASPFA
eukprot:GHVT01060020.1.p1 GENE.GHVT01060020.1~~GHVT01060020.1.p1  ORF type:complete len:298 (-),score=29.58 GHVT01060020.1:843-1736(-)